METSLVAALTPALAAGFAIQRLLEILDPILDKTSKLGNKKIILGLVSLASGFGLARWPDLRVLSHLVSDSSSVPTFLDYLVTSLIVSGGTEGFNAILKFMNYKKEETKAAAITETLAAKKAESQMTIESLTITENDEANITPNQCIAWRQGEFRQRVRQAVAEWAQEPVSSILPTNTLGELSKGTPWNVGQQARLTQSVNAHNVFAPPFPNSRMSPLSQVLPPSTSVAQWEKIVWRQQNPQTPCFPFTD